MASSLLGTVLLLTAIGLKVFGADEASVLVMCAFLGFWMRHWMSERNGKSNGK